MKSVNELVVDVQKVLEENGVWAEVYQYESLPVIAVEIHWGDWKHDHLRADWLIEEMGGNRISVKTTQEDGSDCYSAIRYYMF